MRAFPDRASIKVPEVLAGSVSGRAHQSHWKAEWQLFAIPKGVLKEPLRYRPAQQRV